MGGRKNEGGVISKGGGRKSEGGGIISKGGGRKNEGGGLKTRLRQNCDK